MLSDVRNALSSSSSFKTYEYLWENSWIDLVHCLTCEPCGRNKGHMSVLTSAYITTSMWPLFWATKSIDGFVDSVHTRISRTYVS